MKKFVADVIIIVPSHSSVAQWLRCYATNRKVTGSIPAGVSVIGIFHWHKVLPIALWLVAPASNRNEYQQHYLGGKGGRCVRLTTHHHPVPLSWNLGNVTFWSPLGLFRPVIGLQDAHPSKGWASCEKIWQVISVSRILKILFGKGKKMKTFNTHKDPLSITGCMVRDQGT